MRLRRPVPALYLIALALVFLIFAASQPVLASQQQSTTGLTIAPNPAQVGQTVTFTAHVSGAIGVGGVPTGTVTFQNGSMQLGTATVDATGIATFQTSSLALGMYDIVAMYGGDANFAASNSPVVVLNIVPVGTQNPSTTSLKINPDPAQLGQTITFSAHVAGATGTIGGATGTVTFLNGSTTLATETLDSSSNASFSSSSFGLGTYSITAAYSGDAKFAPSTSPVVMLEVVPVGTLTPTTTTLVSSKPSSNFGDNVTFTATVSGGFGNPPTGTVTFLDGSTTLGTGTLANGIATYSTNTLAVGTHAITGQYSGDSTFESSTSPVLTQTVNNSGGPTFILTVSPTTVIVHQGNSGTATVTLEPSGGFNQQVTFLCSGLPLYAICTFSPPTITPDGSNSSSQVVMTVTTNVQTSLLRMPRFRREGRLLADMMAIFSVGMLGLVQVKVRRRRKSGRRTRAGSLATWFLLALGVLAALCLVSCGGSGHSNVMTPTGTTDVTIAGSTATGAQTTTFTLTVQ